MSLLFLALADTIALSVLAYLLVITLRARNRRRQIEQLRRLRNVIGYAPERHA